MDSELSNLLPESRKRELRRLYFLRLGTMMLALLSFLVVMHGIMLIPTYLYANSEAERGKMERARLNASAQDAGQEEVTKRGAQLAQVAGTLTRLESQPAASTAFRTVLGVARPGIALTGFSFSSPGTPNTEARMQVSGVASSRDALRQYVAALGTLPFVTSANLPISAYAKESNIDFTITLTGTLMP